MDQSVLVSSGHALIRELDKAKLAPRFAMWVHNTEPDTWKPLDRASFIGNDKL
jgi:hypothetical protein